jgi:hypothetical protein
LIQLFEGAARALGAAGAASRLLEALPAGAIVALAPCLQSHAGSLHEVAESVGRLLRRAPAPLVGAEQPSPGATVELQSHGGLVVRAFKADAVLVARLDGHFGAKLGEVRHDLRMPRQQLRQAKAVVGSRPLLAPDERDVADIGM